MILRMGRQPGLVGGGVAIAPGVAAHEPYARRAMAALRPGFGLSKLSMTARSEPDTKLDYRYARERRRFRPGNISAIQMVHGAERKSSGLNRARPAGAARRAFFPWQTKSNERTR